MPSHICSSVTLALISLSAAASLHPVCPGLSARLQARSTSETKAETRPLTVEAIYGHRPIGGSAPQGLTWSPDGQHLTYLEGGELLDLDPQTAKTRVLVSKVKLSSLTGDTTTEKDRDHRARYGMASYLWAPDSAHLLFDANGRLWFYDLKTGTGLNIGSSGAASGDDPKFSPDGHLLSFISERGEDHGLSIIHLRDAGAPTSPVAITNNPAVLNGKVDWVYEEELAVRSNYFWSPDSAHLVYLQMDESNVPKYPITDWIPVHPAIDEQRYPQPGDPNPDVRVGITGINPGKTQWIKFPPDAFKPGDDYIPRFGWVDRKTVWVETLTRDHKHLNLYFAEINNGQAHLALQQSDDKFFDEKYDIHLQDGQIILTSWADGHTHIYLYTYDTKNPMGTPAKLDRQLTKGDFDVDSILGIDSARKLVYYDSNEGNPLEAQLWQVDFQGNHKALTTTPGRHNGNFAPTGGAYVDRFSTRMTPTEESLCIIGSQCHLFWSTHAYDSMHLLTPQQLETKTSEGTTLYATLLLPEGKTDPASVPLIINPYGGPGPMEVQNAWGGDGFLFDQLLAQHGFAVLHTDNRGSGRRGRDFAQAAYHNFGPIQFQDQITMADAALAKYPQLDPKRQAWWGWSWGGTFTLYAMTHSDRFRAGVSVAPVDDWHNYDSIYTERYMSTPAEFPTGYKDFSVITPLEISRAICSSSTAPATTTCTCKTPSSSSSNSSPPTSPTISSSFRERPIPSPESKFARELFNRILAQFETYLKRPVEAAK